MVTTPLHFTESIINFSVLFGDDQVNINDEHGNETYQYVSNVEYVNEKQKIDQIQELIRNIKKYAEFFVDISLQSLEMQDLKYSMQGLYSVLASREIMNVKPIWNNHFTNFTNIPEEYIDIDILKTLLKLARNEVYINTKEDCATPKQCHTTACTTVNRENKSEIVSPLSGCSLSKYKQHGLYVDTKKYTHLDKFSEAVDDTKDTSARVETKENKFT